MRRSARLFKYKMKRSGNLTKRFLLVVFAATSLLSARSFAQIDEGEKRAPRSQPVRTRTIIQTKIKVVKVPEVKYQKISGLAITTVQPNAVVVLESANPRKKYKQIKNTDADGVLNMDVPPGKYLLTVSLKGFVTEESDVEILPQQLVTVPVNLAEITHDIFIKTNVASGEVRYAPIENQPQNGGAKDIGGYCMVPIKNGSAAILRMREGDYNLEIHPEDVEYRMVSREITISGKGFAVAENNLPNNEISIKLERTISTEDFLANWLPNEWKLPANWKIENKRMHAVGAGVALLQNERFNHYKDFELKTNVRSLDGKTVGFVLRAKDKENYYLIEITGGRTLFFDRLHRQKRQSRRNARSGKYQGLRAVVQRSKIF